MSEIHIPSQSQWIEQKKRMRLFDEIDLAYIEIGDDPGKPLLMIHGFTDTSRTWSSLAGLLPNRRLIAIDLRGHGDSSSPESGYAVDQLAREMSEFLDRLEIDRVDVIGHSLGSLIAQALAAFFPDKVDKLILVASGVRAPAGPGELLWEKISPLRFPLDPQDEFISEWCRDALYVNAEFDHLSRWEVSKTPRHVWRSVLQALSITDLSHIQHLIQSELLIIWGDQDRAFRRSDQDDLINAHPNAIFLPVAGSGHAPHWVVADMLAQKIESFLSGRLRSYCKEPEVLRP